MLTVEFFDRDTLTVAKELIGKVIYHKYGHIWLKAKIIETEAYLLEEKGSHASLGYSEKRKALFMPPGTIYMYYARGKDSFNISTKGSGNAVLIKSGIPYLNEEKDERMLNTMKALNTLNGTPRETSKLCSGQTLLAKSLNLKVKDLDQKQFSKGKIYIEDVGYTPKRILQTQRLGIPIGRDEHLMYRFIDFEFKEFCTKNPVM